MIANAEYEDIGTHNSENLPWELNEPISGAAMIQTKRAVCAVPR